jgi:hypothetical protein
MISGRRRNDVSVRLCGCEGDGFLHGWLGLEVGVLERWRAGVIERNGVRHQMFIGFVLQVGVGGFVDTV